MAQFWPIASLCRPTAGPSSVAFSVVLSGLSHGLSVREGHRQAMDRPDVSQVTFGLHLAYLQHLGQLRPEKGWPISACLFIVGGN